MVTLECSWWKRWGKPEGFPWIIQITNIATSNLQWTESNHCFPFLYIFVSCLINSHLSRFPCHKPADTDRSALWLILWITERSHFPNPSVFELGHVNKFSRKTKYSMYWASQRVPRSFLKVLFLFKLSFPFFQIIKMSGLESQNGKIQLDTKNESRAVLFRRQSPHCCYAEPIVDIMV